MRIKSLPVLALSFLAGVIGLQLFSQLPSIYWGLSLIPVVFVAFYRRGSALVLLFFCCGFFWAYLFAWQYLQHIPTRSIAGKNITVTGIVSGIPERREKSTRILFDIETFKAENYPDSVPQKIRLNWYYPKSEVLPGERWQFVIRLKPPNGFQNPGGFDYEAWLYQQGIHATGYIKKHPDNKKLADAEIASALSTARFKLMQLINLSVEPGVAALLNALAIGYRGDIENASWQVFIRTGTNHLIAISGLHIGLVAGFAWFVLNQLRRIKFFVSRLNRRWMLIISFMLATIYAGLAGFTIPTQRALVMLAVVYLGLYFYRQVSVIQSLSIALLAVLIFSPLSVLSVGFWLSFIAVAAIAYSIAGRLSGRQKALQWLWPQMTVILALMPLSFYFFQQNSLVALIANVVAIPLVGLLVLPLLLTGLLLASFSTVLALPVISLSASLLAFLFGFLKHLSDSDLAVWFSAAPDIPALIFAMLAMLLLFSPYAIPARWLAICLFLPLFNSHSKPIANGSIEIQAIDVGQGLSVLIRTSQHQMLFDTGAKFSERFDVGERVIVPLLRQQGISALDMLMISNGDRDHIGGARAVLKAVNVKQLLGRDIEKLAHGHKQLCKRGQSWQWDDVRFDVLHPGDRHYKKRNNHSCVLKISNQNASVLIAADIEKQAESVLLREQPDQLSSSVLIVPHHGSNTSSTRAFLQQVHPELAVYSSGFLNRYGFPRAEVIERYQQLDIKQVNTAENGHIWLKIDQQGKLHGPIGQRQTLQRYWHRQAN